MVVVKIKESACITHMEKPPYVRKIKVYAYLESKLTADQELKIIEFFKNL